MRILLFTAAIFLVQGLSAQMPPVPQYKVGDTVCGGVLFYVVNNNQTHRQRGLVAATQDLDAADHLWYTGVYDTTNATVDSLFDKLNARTILNKEGYSGSYAALLCNQYVVPGQPGICTVDTPWYLPSRVELDTLWSVMGSKGLWNFVNEGYWSSVEGGGPGNFDSSNFNNIARNAWIVDFYLGKVLLVDKANQYRLRPVREIDVPYVKANTTHAIRPKKAK